MRASLTVDRLAGNPIVTGAMLPGTDGENIAGPSLIRAPEWLPGRLGEYYLYFAHHVGLYIRLAVADRLEGPWRIHEPGSLRLERNGRPLAMNAPDVHVDEERRQIRMYFQCPGLSRDRRKTHLAVSPDGVSFTTKATGLADFYLRMAPWRDGWIGMSKGGALYTRRPGSEELRRYWRPAFPMSGRWANKPGDVRHVALRCVGDTLTVYFTRIGDAPERVFVTEIDLARPAWLRRAGEAQEILRPELPWEGADLPLRPSRSGPAGKRENALRDPAIFAENGHTFLLYAVAGEGGIAIAELVAQTGTNL